MKVGFSRLDITPPFGYSLVGYPYKRPADDIITPLYVNAVVIDDGETRAALVTLDAEGATAECTKIIREYNKSTDSALFLLAYDADKFEKMLDDPRLIKTPVVRNGKHATVGYAPDVWGKGE